MIDLVFNDDELTNLTLIKKKKNKNKNKEKDDKELHNTKIDELDTKPNYSYKELLNKLYEQLGDVNSSTRGLIISQPIVERMSNNRSLWYNFNQICVSLKRPIKHLFDFVVYELNTQATINKNNQMVIRGNYYSKNIANVLTKYIIHYVQCYVCRSYSTSIMVDKFSRVKILQCENCKCSRVITKIE